MKLVLFEGKENEKVYYCERPMGRIFREAIALSKRKEINDVTPEVLDELLVFVVKAFDKQFTIDDLYDGIYANKLIDTVSETIQFVINGTTEVEESDEKK